MTAYLRSLHWQVDRLSRAIQESDDEAHHAFWEVRGALHNLETAWSRSRDRLGGA